MWGGMSAWALGEQQPGVQWLGQGTVGWGGRKCGETRWGGRRGSLAWRSPGGPRVAVPAVRGACRGAGTEGAE